MKINKQQLILVIFLIGFSIICINGTTLVAFCGFDGKLLAHYGDPEYVIKKLFAIANVISWGILGLSGAGIVGGLIGGSVLTIANVLYNSPFIISYTLYNFTPLGRIEDVGVGGLNGILKFFNVNEINGFLRGTLEAYPYDSLFVKTKNYFFPTKPVNIPASGINVPVIQINPNPQTGLNSTESQLLPSLNVEPNSEPVTPREYPEDFVQQTSPQPKSELVENGTQASFFPEIYSELVRKQTEKVVVYKDRQNLISILNKLDKIDPLLIEHNLILQGLQGIQGRNGLLKEIKNLEQFNNPQVLIKYYYRPLASNLIIKGVKFNFDSMLLPNVKLHKHAFRIDLLFGDFNNQTIVETVGVDFDKFGKDFPFIAKTLEICFRNAEKHKFQLGIPKPYINLVYRQESTGYFGNARNIITPEESTIVYTSTGNNFPLMDTVLDLFSAQNDIGVQPEIDRVCRSLKKYIGKNLLGVPKETDIITIVYDNVVSSLNTQEAASLFIATKKRTISINPLTRKSRMKETGIQNTIEVDSPNLPMNNSCDVVSPAVVGGTVLATGAISGLAQIPIEEAWNLIFNSQASASLLTDSHFVSVVSQAFPNVQIPVQETVRSLEAAHSIVDTVVTNSNLSSISNISEGSLPVSTSNITSSLNGILPAVNWSNIIIGAGVISVTLGVVYLWKNGFGTQATEVTHHSKAVAEAYKILSTLKK